MAAITLNVLGSDRQVTVNLPEPKNAVLHEVVTWQLAKRRRGTVATKTRAEIRASKRKIYQQKGTGRARHGAVSAPIFVGGSKAFGPKPRDYNYSLPKKVRRLGLQMAIADRANEGKLSLVEDFPVSEGKTKEFVKWAKDNGFDGKERVLLVTDHELARRAARNLPWVTVMQTPGINVYDIMRHDRLLVDAEIVANLPTLSSRRLDAAPVASEVVAEQASVAVSENNEPEVASVEETVVVATAVPMDSSVETVSAENHDDVVEPADGAEQDNTVDTEGETVSRSNEQEAQL